MNNYAYMTPVTEPNTNAYYGQRAVNPERLENFKSAIEAHVQLLTNEVRTLKDHANWIEPRLNDYHKFMEWMQRVHPDVIAAYTQATKVEKALDDALDSGEMVYPQAGASA